MVLVLVGVPIKTCLAPRQCCLQSVAARNFLERAARWCFQGFYLHRQFEIGRKRLAQTHGIERLVDGQFGDADSLFWLGWTVWPSLSPIVPSLGGIFFGLGFQLLFMGMTNYLTDVFRSHSASALGAAAMLRSIGATTLPLAADNMYTNLGIHWAPSVLAFVALAMGFIPFVFIRYGDRLARSSKTAREAFAIQN